MYEELIERMRKWREEQPMLREASEMFDDSANAIEKLTKKCQSSAENNIRLIEQYDNLKNRISKLNDHQHYSGAYIKAIMGG